MKTPTIRSAVWSGMIIRLLSLMVELTSSPLCTTLSRGLNNVYLSNASWLRMPENERRYSFRSFLFDCCRCCCYHPPNSCSSFPVFPGLFASFWLCSLRVPPWGICPSRTWLRYKFLADEDSREIKTEPNSLRVIKTRIKTQSDLQNAFAFDHNL